MESNWNLSEKEINRSNYIGGLHQFYYLGEDVKEFIRLLKEEISNNIYYTISEDANKRIAKLIQIRIDKLCGDKLINEETKLECKHDWGNTLLMSNPPQRRCIKCGKTEYVK